MNTTFNLKRFFLLEKYKKQETGKHLLWSADAIAAENKILFDENFRNSFFIIYKFKINTIISIVL